MKSLIKKLLKFIPDKTYLELYYFAKFRKRLHLKSPQTFNEKLQWLKLYDQKRIYTTMVDKYDAKKYAAEKIGEAHIIPTLGVWDRVEDIDFDSLPAKFVLKCTHDSGGLVVCRDKSKLDWVSTKNKLEHSLKHQYFYEAREWPYKNVKPRIIAEKYMEDEEQLKGLIDYKFYCFAGIPRFLYVSQGLEDHATANISFLNLDWTFAPFQRGDYKGFETLPKKPENFNRMIEFATLLSQETIFVRVDLYEINHQIYFSELTFTPCGGMMRFKPEQWDTTLGNWINLPDGIREDN